MRTPMRRPRGRSARWPPGSRWSRRQPRDDDGQIRTERRWEGRSQLPRELVRGQDVRLRQLPGRGCDLRRLAAPVGRAVQADGRRESGGTVSRREAVRQRRAGHALGREAPARQAVTSVQALIREKAERDPTYAPYCMRCAGFVRMRRVAPFYWRCECGAEHDSRTEGEMTRPPERK